MARRVPLARLAADSLAPIAADEAVARIVCGEVLVNGECVRDPKRLVAADAVVTLREIRRFVSRAGLKLQHAVEVWSLAVSERAFVDAGSSTGGFTDCLLRNGARRVYAVDVGRNLLDFRLRSDPRVSVMEGTRVMDLRPSSFAEPPAAAVADLSFRSLRGAASHLLSLVSEGWMVALAKPQFEWARPQEGFDGVVRERSRVTEILISLVRDLRGEGAHASRALVAPLRGRRGNVEVLVELRARPDCDAAEAERRLLQALDQLLP